MCCEPIKMVEFAGLEKLGCGIGFGYIFPGKMAIRVFDPWRRLNHMMQDIEIHVQENRMSVHF